MLKMTSKDEKRRPLLVIDGDNLAHRAYHTMPKSVTGEGGQVINAIVGFVSMLINVWQKERPRGVFVAWDTLGVDTYRNELWPPYQGGRIFEREIREQLDLLPKICETFAFGVGKKAGYEADDLMAAAALKEVANGGTVLLYTTDRDAYQLVNENITVLAPRPRNPEPDRIGPREVVERFGVLPEQVPCFKALCGDASDKIPGIRGIGPKSAASLLLKHGNLESALSSWPNPADAELAFKFREVVRMRTDVAVELPAGPPDWNAGADALRKLGASNLADRVAKLV